MDVHCFIRLRFKHQSPSISAGHVTPKSCLDRYITLIRDICEVFQHNQFLILSFRFCVFLWGVETDARSLFVLLSSPPPLTTHTQSFLVTFLTRCSAVAGQTKTHKRVDLIDAGSSVLARVGLAVVNVCRWREEEERRGGEKRRRVSLSHACYRTNPSETRTFCRDWRCFWEKL